MWVIQYFDTPPCWLSAKNGDAPFDVTWQLKNARSFVNREDARHEILRLGLPGIWVAIQIAEYATQEVRTTT